ncbi:MAG: substrate-binding domain-containing protein [Clostridia bacterium]|nr:substrate-binding domain-containing protein [Clostridia bacterium]
MKKLIAMMLVLAMSVSLVACSSSKTEESSAAESSETVTEESKEEVSEESAEESVEEAVEEVTETAEAGTKIYILTASEDHGWTGSVATFAKEKAEEINAEGKYTAEVITSADAAAQITNIEDILAKDEENIAFVIQPMDDTVQSAIQQIVDKKIPYTAFDRIIEGVADSAVANVRGDNAGIGAAAAAYFVSLGMQPGDKVLVIEGDTSSVTTLRDAGFVDYVTGKVEFEGATIADDAKWSEDDVAAITYSGAMNWSRSATKEYFETLMSDNANTDIKWIYAQDDEFSMGVFEALAGGGIDDANKEAFLGNAPAITGCGGLGQMYDVIRGTEYADITASFSGVCSVTYSPSMIQTTAQDMIDYLNGETVAQDHVIACENVVAENVENYKSFN